jgi:acylphosphatase
MRTVHLFIAGRVQGVGYRAWFAAEARARGLEGWVRNLRDGRVEAVLHGDRAVVDAMADACRDGPPQANVSGIVNQAWTGGTPQGFSVLPTV